MQKLVLMALSVFVFCGSGRAASGEQARELKEAGTKLEKILTRNILPFWHPKVIDKAHGGYRLNHDGQGKWRGPADKYLVTQARTVWFFARLCRSPHDSPAYRAAAAHGFRFLRDAMWDKEAGGFFWAVDSTGKTVKQGEKHLYGQAFGLYALSEYAATLNDAEAKALADRLFMVLEKKAHDGKHGGYREAFKSDWRALPGDAKTRLGVPPDVKLMNTHLHLMEAMTTYYRLSKSPLARQRLLELIMIQSNTVVRKTLCACTDQFAADWTPLRGAVQDCVSYGHDIENVWLLQDACDAVGMPHGPLLDLYHGLFDYSLKYGFDREQGGFYYFGPFNQAATDRHKDWWVQAECMISALKMYGLTGKTIYRQCFLKTLDWIVKQQVDWKNGDWFSRIAPDGRKSGGKAGPWKSPYHNGRAVIRCLELLSN